MESLSIIVALTTRKTRLHVLSRDFGDENVGKG